MPGVIGKQIECQLASNLSRLPRKAVKLAFLSEALDSGSNAMGTVPGGAFSGKFLT